MSTARNVLVQDDADDVLYDVVHRTTAAAKDVKDGLDQLDVLMVTPRTFPRFQHLVQALAIAVGCSVSLCAVVVVMYMYACDEIHVHIY